MSRGEKREPGNLEFRARRAACQILDRASIEISCREIHLGEFAVGTQQLVDKAYALEHLRPVDCGNEAHARDDIADRNVRCALPLMLLSNDLVGGGLLIDQAFVEPQ